MRINFILLVTLTTLLYSGGKFSHEKLILKGVKLKIQFQKIIGI